MEVHAHQPVSPIPEDPPVNPPNVGDHKSLLLHLIASIPKQPATRGDLNKKLDTRPAKLAGLTKDIASTLIPACQSEGLIAVTKAKQTQQFEVTEQGKSYLEANPATIQPSRTSSGRRINEAVSETVHRLRNEFLLLEVFKKPDRSLADADISRCLNTYARQTLELNTLTARRVLANLTTGNLLNQSGQGRLIRFELAPAGLKALANTTFPEETTFRLSGKILNALLESAREVGKEFAPEPQRPAAPATPEAIKAFILRSIAELRAERYAHSDLVPIWEIRQAVREGVGQDSATHATFDELVLQLWRDGKVTLTAISDLSKTTPQQVQDAIPGSGNTLFYIEAAHEFASV